MANYPQLDDCSGVWTLKEVNDAVMGGYWRNVGALAVFNGGNSPQDWDLIGATVDGSSETGLGELANKAAVKSYLDTYTSDWKDRNADDEEIDFDQDAAATYIWSKKTS